MIAGSAKAPTFGCDASPKLSNCSVKRAYGDEAQCSAERPPAILVEATITWATRGPATGKRNTVMSSVFVVDTNRQPQSPVHPGRARLLLKEGKAAVLRRFPFTIILKSPGEQPTLAPLRLKIDPGAQTTGLALLNDANGEVVWAAEVSHRGEAIKAALDTRRAVRHSRRSRKTRYRVARFANRRRRQGWLPPSLESRIANVLTWVARLRRLCPLEGISLELVKFDTQAIQNPEIAGIEYQQGELLGYELRNYLLEKWGRACVYCGKQGVPLQIDHIQARTNGGSDRVSNLTLACGDCNQRKGNQDVRVFLGFKPDVLARLLAQAKAPLRDAAAVNTTSVSPFTAMTATLTRKEHAMSKPLEPPTQPKRNGHSSPAFMTGASWPEFGE